MRTPHWFLLSASLALLLATDAVQGQQHGASHSAPAPRAALPHYYHAAPRPVPANHPVNHSLPANGANRTQVVTFHRQNFYHNTYVWHGQTYNRFYRRYNWHGVGLRIYTPARFYPIGFYGWAGRPWGGRVTYGWGWQHRPWYGYYGYYFAPYPYYVGPSAWLTDYMLSSDLEASYDDVPAGGGGDAPPPAADAAPDSGPELTPEIKNLIAQEIQADIEVENGEAALNAAGQVGTRRLAASQPCWPMASRMCLWRARRWRLRQWWRTGQAALPAHSV